MKKALNWRFRAFDKKIREPQMDEGENRVLRIQFDEDLQPAARRNHGENGRVQKILESGIHKDHNNT